MTIPQVAAAALGIWAAHALRFLPADPVPALATLIAFAAGVLPRLQGEFLSRQEEGRIARARTTIDSHLLSIEFGQSAKDEIGKIEQVLEVIQQYEARAFGPPLDHVRGLLNETKKQMVRPQPKTDADKIVKDILSFRPGKDVEDIDENVLRVVQGESILLKQKSDAQEKNIKSTGRTGAKHRTQDNMSNTPTSRSLPLALHRDYDDVKDHLSDDDDNVKDHFLDPSPYGIAPSKTWLSAGEEERRIERS